MASATVHASLRLGATGVELSNGEYVGRFLIGATLKWLPTPPVTLITDTMKLGIETGVLYSHVDGGGNLALIPVQFAASERWERFLVTGLLGVTLAYRSVSNAIKLGREDDSAGDSIEPLGSFGAEFQMETGTRVTPSLRGTYIVTPADDIFTASIGVSFSLG